MKLEFSRQIFEKYSNIKFHENPSSGSRVFHADRRTDMTKLTVAFRNFANEPKRRQLEVTKMIFPIFCIKEMCLGKPLKFTADSEGSLNIIAVIYDTALPFNPLTL